MRSMIDMVGSIMLKVKSKMYLVVKKGCRQKDSFWSERSACVACAALQTGCMANVVASINRGGVVGFF